MKGTLFSADFIKDSSDNLRLLELNTDTTISKNNLEFLDFSEFISILNFNNITKVTVIHKPDIHKHIVNELSSSLQVSASFITEFNEVKEAGSTIYPTIVEDDNDKFVLRMAYDESAIFDSEYAKDKLNLLKLFTNNNSSSLVPGFYHSSEAEGTIDTLTRDFNLSNIADCVVKGISDQEHPYLNFYKIGKQSESDTDEYRWNSFISASSSESTLIQNYYVSPNTISNNKISSIRLYSIVYGSDLSLVHIGEFEQDSPFELPSIPIYNPDLIVNKIDAKHYYEFATNIPKFGSNIDGILSSHLVIKDDGTSIELENVSVGDTLKSYYIGGTIQSEDDLTYTEWSMTGSDFPSGSFLTSSVVVYKNSRELTDKTLTKLTIANGVDELFVATNKSFLVYDSGSNITSWEHAMHIDPATDYLMDYDGDLAGILKNEMVIINEDTFRLVELDVEETDTFIISGSTSINSFVVHNAPCFVAGTEILLGSGKVKSIETIEPKDLVLTFNFKTNEVELQEVNNVFSKKVDETVEYIFDNGTYLQSTIDHPIYVEGKGWCSYAKDKSNSMYTLSEGSVQSIELGDTIKLSNGLAKLVEFNHIQEPVNVYNLQDINKNQNYFANGVLVHNRKA